MTQQGPPPPRSGRPDSRSRRPSWQDSDNPDDEEYPPWAGLGILPRYADGGERERRRLGIREDATGTQDVGRHGDAGVRRPAGEDAGRFRSRRAPESDRDGDGYGPGEGSAAEHGRRAGRRRADPGDAPERGFDSGYSGERVPETGSHAPGRRRRPESGRSGPDDGGYGYDNGGFGPQSGDHAAGGHAAGGHAAGGHAAGGDRGRRAGRDLPARDVELVDLTGDALSVPPSRTRAAATRLRRSRRTVWFRAGALVAVIVLGVGGWLIFGSQPAAHAPGDGLVTTFQPGELKTVPNACSAVSSATLSQYLPGHRSTVTPHSLFGRQQSSCAWTVDAHPLYRLLQLSFQAYAPNGLVARGDGSATAAAVAAYQQAMSGKAHPPKKTHQPAAQITTLHGLGQSAFLAFQNPTAEGATTDVVTVVVRVRNVLVTAEYEGMATRNGTYGPVSTAQLRSGAIAAARESVSRIG